MSTEISSANTSLQDDLVLYEVRNRIVWLTLNRPDKRNALNAQMVTALKEAITKAVAEPENRVIVLAAAGKVFCSGADLDALKQLQTNTFEQNLADSQHLRGLFDQIANCPLPVIAAVQGAALAGGCGLATVADFTIAVPGAQMGYTEVRIGFIPALVSAYLVKRIGEAKARPLLLSGDLITTERALALGLITEVVEADALYTHVQQLAERLANQNSKQAMAATKALLTEMDGLSVHQATELAAVANAHARATDDCQRGIAGFLAKAPVTW